MRSQLFLLLGLWVSRASCSERARANTSDPAAETARARAEVGEGDAGRPRPRRIGARHVLVMHRESERAPESITRSRAEAQARADEVLRRARAGGDFAQLAGEFSDEPGAQARGGALGMFGRGQMVPAFEEAAFALEVNEISAVVETSFGFHVIQRTE
ncbi:MAG: peptidyl-prolyl cis-trans isomerase [Myxococcales bacterium]|nr:peptidyl-prolyl cis-trans isomerase [Myxococcales bacterium]